MTTLGRSGASRTSAGAGRTARHDGMPRLDDRAGDPGGLRNLVLEPAHAGQVEARRRRLLDRLVEAETVEPWQGGLAA